MVFQAGPSLLTLSTLGLTGGKWCLLAGLVCMSLGTGHPEHLSCACPCCPSVSPVTSLLRSRTCFLVTEMRKFSKCCRNKCLVGWVSAVFSPGLWLVLPSWCLSRAEGGRRCSVLLRPHLPSSFMGCDFSVTSGNSLSHSESWCCSLPPCKSSRV